LSFPTHEHNLTFHLPRSSFNFFQQCFQSTVFVHFCQIYPYFVFFGAVVKWWCFKNLFLVVISAKKYKYFCMFLYSLLLPNSLVRSNSFFVDIIRFSIHTVYLTHFLTGYHFFSCLWHLVQCWIEVMRASIFTLFLISGWNPKWYYFFLKCLEAIHQWSCVDLMFVFFVEVLNDTFNLFN